MNAQNAEMPLYSTFDKVHEIGVQWSTKETFEQ